MSDEEDVTLQKWRELHTGEDQARAEFLAVATQGEATEGRRKELARKWWATVEAMLRFYSREMAYNRHHQLEPTPVTLLWALHGLAGHLAVGHMPGPISDVIGRGTAAIGPSERLHIGWATGYLRLAASGGIDDPTPIKTVMDHYGVRRQTVQRWGKLPLPDDVLAALESADAVAFHMRNAGSIYREHGRSTEAIQARGRRQPGAI